MGDVIDDKGDVEVEVIGERNGFSSGLVTGACRGASSSSFANLLARAPRSAVVLCTLGMNMGLFAYLENCSRTLRARCHITAASRTGVDARDGIKPGRTALKYDTARKAQDFSCILAG